MILLFMLKTPCLPLFCDMSIISLFVVIFILLTPLPSFLLTLTNWTSSRTLCLFNSSHIPLPFFIFTDLHFPTQVYRNYNPPFFFSCPNFTLLLLYFTQLHHIFSTLSCNLIRLSCPVLSCPVLSCPVLSYPVLSTFLLLLHSSFFTSLYTNLLPAHSPLPLPSLEQQWPTSLSFLLAGSWPRTLSGPRISTGTACQVKLIP